MRTRYLILIPVCASVILAKPVWKPLFNGKSFGPEWRFVGDSAFWTIDPKDSAIVGYSATSKTPHSLLFTNKADYDQFTVKYAYRLKAGCSGFWFRTHGATPSDVAGPQVEIKREGAELLEVGSIYAHPAPGWEVQHSRAYSLKTAPKVDEYQEVILTVKKPNVYVNVNGSQAVGETDAAALAAGAKPAWNYTGSEPAKLPGSFALQVHEGYAIDVRFKGIMILAGCGDAASPRYDGEFVPGFPRQPAVYQDDGSCGGTGLEQGGRGGLKGLEGLAYAPHLGMPRRIGNTLELAATCEGPNTLDILTLDGRAVFNGTAPGAHVYRLAARMEAGLYLARLTTLRGTESRRILVT
ncbi:MAG: hypothetical protein JWP91_3102 [Fibrobacteres bacterium]|nr:hypothetical protein [Fibrobacterota bacterium]